MNSTWTALGAIAGTGALAYLAAGRETAKGSKQSTLRLSLDKEHSLITDVRLLGGAATLLASMFVKEGSARNMLRLIAVGSGASLLTTELIRWRLNKDQMQVSGKLPLMPGKIGQASFGALPRAGAWAQR